MRSIASRCLKVASAEALGDRIGVVVIVHDDAGNIEVVTAGIAMNKGIEKSVLAGFRGEEMP